MYRISDLKAGGVNCKETRVQQQYEIITVSSTLHFMLQDYVLCFQIVVEPLFTLPLPSSPYIPQI